MDCDLIIVDGGLAGAALAKAMAEYGAAVLVLERERRFRDRVRGEGMQPWGVAEARALGLYDPLIATCADEVRWVSTYSGASLLGHRDLVETTAHHAGFLNFYHPEMQDVLLGQAETAGARVWRGATVTGIAPGTRPSVTARVDGSVVDGLQGRLVVGADGRQSRMRRWAPFSVSHDPPRLLVAGVLLTGMTAPEDTLHIFGATTHDRGVLYVPLRGGRGRVYLITARRTEHARLSGAAQTADLIAQCIDIGVPPEWFAHAERGGPLASFEGSDVWVEHPCQDGVVLVGDAAAACNPSFGCGLALTLRDVRVLRDLLRASDDWVAAAHAYAMEHDQYFGALRELEAWQTVLRFTPGPEADRTRAHALPQIAAGYGPDFVGLGPDNPVDPATRLQLLGY